MGIKVAHEPAFEAVGKSAYSIGVGAKKERDQIRAEQNYFRERQLAVAEAQTVLHDRRQKEALAQRGEQFQQEIDYREGQRQADRDMAQRMYEDEPGRALQEAMNQQKLLQDRIKWEYTEGQKREQQKLQDSIGWVRQQVAEGKWTAEQAEEAERQLQGRYHAIVPLPRLDDTPTPQDMLNQNMVITETGQRLFFDPKNGKFYEVDDPQAQRDSDFVIARAKMVSDLLKITTEDAGIKKLAYPPEIAEALVDRILGISSQGQQRTQLDTGEQPPQAPPEEMQELFGNLLSKVTSGKGWGKATQEAMTNFGKKFVAGAIEKGAEPQQAIDTFMQLWEKEWKNKGFWKNDVVPDPAKFDKDQLLPHPASQSELFKLPSGTEYIAPDGSKRRKR